MSRETDRLETEAEETRAEVSELINEVKARLEPAQVVEEVMDYAREGLKGVMNDFAHTISDSAQRNPIPFLLIGAGLAWVVYDQARGNGKRTHHIGPAQPHVRGADSMPRPESQRFGSAAGGDLATRIDRGLHDASEAAGRARAALSDAAAEAQSRLSSVTDTANAGYRQAREFVRDAGTTVDRASSNVRDFAEAQPLVLGAIGLAIGAALGAAIPLSAEENRLMGDAAADVRDAASRAASEGVERAKSVAQRTYEVAAEAAREEAGAQGFIDPPENAQGNEQRSGNGSIAQH
jgi:hypothetical protein